MVDPVRHDLTQVVRKCPEIILEQPEIAKILNGKYQEVIDAHLRENRKLAQITAPENIDEFSMPPAPTSK